ncbi:helix-turn-helix transcriptional regulator [Leifsonia shinshuensis]|uniref:helix-turn-helix domain-containing protein n=1 Tax=Leifsonia shinshuensis TaxID=150026 RepID=UPI001F505D5B|nr:helix-turn-helix transcriptional regulator [Leifsonia shinshuensis]MCI0158357.1 helix-turn-helix transcriptional regulator [Leifsonia shinshuensis]
MANAPDPVSARESLRRGAWAEAVGAYSAVLAVEDDPIAHEGIAQAYWWLDDGVQCLRHREAAYRGHRDRGDDLGAARAATSLAWDALLFGQGAAVARGWIARAGDLLESEPLAVEHGWYAVRAAELALSVDEDPVSALDWSERACATGRRVADADLAFAGQAYAGLSMVMAGDVDAGIRLLDGAVAAATAGDVADPMWMGKICCWLIVACRQSQDIERAAEWSARVAEISRARDLAPLTSVCRIQYAAVQMERGGWRDADLQLRSTLTALSDSRRESRVEAVAQLGELRRRQGRLAEAESLLRQAEFFGPAIVSRARLHLDLGDAATAWTALRAHLADLPTTNLLTRAAVLPAAVEAALAADRVDDANALVAELETTADLVGTEPLRAFAAAAAASIASGPAALSRWREAVHRFAASGLRYEEARARRALGDALAALGDPAGAREQQHVADSILSDLGVHSGVGASVLTTRQAAVLRLIAAGMTNVEIAHELTISEHTVHRHVANILTELGLTSRAAAAAYATSAHLI